MTAAEQMAAALLQLVEREARPPCGDRSGAWTSEDRSERQQAALRCQPCPLLDICGQYAAELKPSFGVWASRDWTPRPMKARTR